MGRRAQRAPRAQDGGAHSAAFHHRQRRRGAGESVGPNASFAEQGVPAYVVFNDATLRELATERPADLAALSGITGVGQAKLDRYGEALLEVLRTA